MRVNRNNPELYIMDNKEKTKILFVLDFTDSKVYRYYAPAAEQKENKVSAHNHTWVDIDEYPDYEDFIMEKGHSLSNCEWMVSNTDRIYGD